MSTEQEYEAQPDMVDDHETADSGPGPYPEPIPPQQHPLHPTANPGHQPGQHVTDHSQGFPSMTQLLDPYDSMLDMDPFGLSASMQFPTSFSL